MKKITRTENECEVFEKLIKGRRVWGDDLCMVSNDIDILTSNRECLFIYTITFEDISYIEFTFYMTIVSGCIELKMRLLKILYVSVDGKHNSLLYWNGGESEILEIDYMNIIRKHIPVLNKSFLDLVLYIKPYLYKHFIDLHNTDLQYYLITVEYDPLNEDNFPIIKPEVVDNTNNDSNIDYTEYNFTIDNSKWKLTTEDVKGKPITDGNGEIIGELVYADNDHIYGHINKTNTIMTNTPVTWSINGK